MKKPTFVPRNPEPDAMLIHELERRGNVFFRWRSFIPLILVPPALVLAYDAPERAGDWQWKAMCWAVGVLGLVIRAKTIGHVPPGTSGRNTSEGQVAETLNTHGMYSLVRHPLYLGNYFMWMALVLATGRLDFALVVTLLYMIYYLRIAMAVGSHRLRPDDPHLHLDVRIAQSRDRRHGGHQCARDGAEEEIQHSGRSLRRHRSGLRANHRSVDRTGCRNVGLLSQP